MLSLKQLGAVYLIIISFSAKAQRWSKVFTDSNSFAIETTKIAGKSHIGYINKRTYYLLNAKGDTLIRKTDYYFDAHFKDFNQDGFADIVLQYESNAPGVWDLFLYVPTTGKFRQITRFRDFPAAERLKGTNLFYSYHKSGCADMNWDSDLFYIKNYKAIKIGNIAGRECSDVKNGIFIYKTEVQKNILFTKLSIDVIQNYKNYKWGFIHEYWTKNHKLFM